MEFRESGVYSSISCASRKSRIQFKLVVLVHFFVLSSLCGSCISNTLWRINDGSVQLVF